MLHRHSVERFCPSIPRFLRDIFRVYKDFDTPHIDTLEIMVERLYQKWGISDDTDFSRLRPTDYPILSDLYQLLEDAYNHYDDNGPHQLYTAEILRDLLLGLHSMCKGRTPGFLTAIPISSLPAFWCSA